MAEENEPTTTTNEQSQEAQLLDDLTVLSRTNSGSDTANPESVGGVPETYEGTGNENLLLDVNEPETREPGQTDQGEIKDDAIAIQPSKPEIGPNVPPQETQSEGRQEPVPFPVMP